MFKELDISVVVKENHRNFIELYRAFIEAVKPENTENSEQRKRAYKLEKKMDAAWAEFGSDERDIIMDVLVNEGFFSKELVDDIHSFNGTIVKFS